MDFKIQKQNVATATTMKTRVKIITNLKNYFSLTKKEALNFQGFINFLGEVKFIYKSDREQN